MFGDVPNKSFERGDGEPGCRVIVTNSTRNEKKKVQKVSMARFLGNLKTSLATVAVKISAFFLVNCKIFVGFAWAAKLSHKIISYLFFCSFNCNHKASSWNTWRFTCEQIVNFFPDENFHFNIVKMKLMIGDLIHCCWRINKSWTWNIFACADVISYT